MKLSGNVQGPLPASNCWISMGQPLRQSHLSRASVPVPGWRVGTLHLVVPVMICVGQHEVVLGPLSRNLQRMSLNGSRNRAEPANHLRLVSEGRGPATKQRVRVSTQLPQCVFVVFFLLSNSLWACPSEHQRHGAATEKPCRGRSRGAQRSQARRCWRHRSAEAER
jgi:hypothetical protein